MICGPWRDGRRVTPTIELVRFRIQDADEATTAYCTMGARPNMGLTATRAAAAPPFFFFFFDSLASSLSPLLLSNPDFPLSLYPLYILDRIGREATVGALPWYISHPTNRRHLKRCSLMNNQHF